MILYPEMLSSRLPLRVAIPALSIALAFPCPLVSQAARVDLRGEFDRLGVPIHQQGQRGACQVFAMVTVAEYLLARHGHPVQLSEQFLMWAANQANGLHRSDGFNPDLLIKGWRAYGIAADRLMPYVPRNEPIAAPSPAALADAATRRTIALTSIKHWTEPIGLTDLQIQAIMARLAAGIPVTVTLCWPFGLTDSQIVDANYFLIDRNINGNDKSGHGVVIVGYQMDTRVPGGGFLIVRNSWGTAFGDKGHLNVSLALARKYGIDAYVVDPTARPIGY